MRFRLYYDSTMKAVANYKYYLNGGVLNAELDTSLIPLLSSPLQLLGSSKTSGELYGPWLAYKQHREYLKNCFERRQELPETFSLRSHYLSE